MQVPGSLYGPYATADRRAQSWVRKLAGGGAPEPIDGEPADSDRLPGLFWLQAPPAVVRGEPAFHCWLPMQHLKAARTREQVGQDVEERCFRDWLAAEWGLVGLLAPINGMWFADRPERFRPFLDAVTRAWPGLYGQGERYSVGSLDARDLWSVHTNLKYVLANMGVPNDVLKGPLPGSGLPVVDRQRP